MKNRVYTGRSAVGVTYRLACFLSGIALGVKLGSERP